MEFVKDYIGHIEKPQVFLCIMKIKDAPIARDLFQWKVYTKCCNSPVRHTPYSGRKSLEGLYVGPAHKITVEQC
jgi:hypothetical protein